MRMKKRLLVVVDMQYDFITGALGSAAAEKIVPSVLSEIRTWVGANEEVVFTRDTHARDYLNTQEGRRLPVEHCVEGEKGWQILEELYTGGRVFDKPTFGSISLGEYVRAGGYEEAVLIGVCTDICVISNALLIKAFAPETRVCVRADCCAGVTKESHETALAAMRACQIDVI